MSLYINRRRYAAILTLAVFFSTGTAGLHASSQQDKFAENTWLELSCGYYQVSDSRYREVYSDGGGIYSIEILRLLKDYHPHSVGIVGGLRYFQQTGCATFSQEKTRLRLLPLALGLRYRLKTRHVTAWAEMGADFYLYKERSVIHDTDGNTWGYHVQAGIYVPLPILPCLSLKCSARHSKAVAEENGLDINLGGAEFSLGVAFGFNLF